MNWPNWLIRRNPITIENLLKEQREEDRLSMTNGYKALEHSSIELLQEVVSLFEHFPDFYNYLESSSFDYYELPYMVFWNIDDYIWLLYTHRNIDMIKQILSYLDKRLMYFYNKSTEGVWLIRIGVLENFDNILGILPNILPLMPDWLRNDFIASFPQYLQK